MHCIEPSTSVNLRCFSNLQISTFFKNTWVTISMPVKFQSRMESRYSIDFHCLNFFSLFFISNPLFKIVQDQHFYIFSLFLRKPSICQWTYVSEKFLLKKVQLLLIFGEDRHGSSPAPPPILGKDLKILDQNNWGRPEQQIKFRGELNLRGDLKF